MRLMKCDCCGAVVDVAEEWALSMMGQCPVTYQDEDGEGRSCDEFKYDLCPDCVREIVEKIKLHRAEHAE